MTGLGYALVGLALAALGIWGAAALAHPLRKLLALNIAGSGVFLILVAGADRAAPGGPVDPVPHALVLTGLVVGVSATALGLVLMLRSSDRPSPPAGGAPDDQAGA